MSAAGSLPPTTGRIVVRGVFTLTGQGTVVAGYASSGRVRSGDRLQWRVNGIEGTALCRSISGVREVPAKDPPTTFYFVVGILPSDLDGVAAIDVYGTATGTPE